MMSYFFLTSTASVWIAIVYLYLRLPRLLNPVASGTVFIWALAAGSAGYIGAIELDSPAMSPLAMSCFFPALLGILLMVNPFSAVHVVIRLFGIVLLITGIIELITTVISHRTAEAVSSEIDHL